MHALRSLGAALPALRVVTGYGWGAAVAGVLCWVAGTALGWEELRLVGLGFLVLLALSWAMTLGGAPVALDLSLRPIRVRPGTPSNGLLVALNTRSRRVPAATLEVPVGKRLESFRMPSLAAGGDARFEFEVPTTRRGVVVVGRVSTVRGDPFGLAKRSVSASEEVELFVHPELVPLPSLDAGLVRDLEGRPTSDPSASDLDFHTLRGYVPGDDRRHIHWQSSARMSAVSGTTTLMMKGYTDTRRSHLGVVVDARLASYVDEDALETAVVAGASIAIRAERDEMDITVVAGAHAMDRVGITRTLDGFARVEPDAGGLPALAARMVTLAPGTSIAVVVTGTENAFTDIQRAAAQFGPHVRIHVLRVAPGAASTTTSVLGFTVLTMGSLVDLSRLVQTTGLA